jgi:hypothetical protein
MVMGAFFEPSVFTGAGSDVTEAALALLCAWAGGPARARTSATTKPVPNAMVLLNGLTCCPPEWESSPHSNLIEQDPKGFPAV